MFFLMPFYLIFALYMINQLMKLYTGKKKWTVFLSLVFIFYLFVGWDVILGRVYFNYLCNKDGGVHIYETVDLGSEYWNEDGSPKFYTDRGAFDESVLEGKYQFVRVRDSSFTTIFNIRRDVHKVIESLNKKILGERVAYQYWGGWVMNTWQPFLSGSLGCHRYYGQSDDKGIISNDLLIVYKKFTSHIFLEEK